MKSSSPKPKITKSIGFGFVPDETNIHFLVDVPRDSKREKQDVSIYERTKWQEGTQKIDPRFDIIKVRLSNQKWAKIQPVLATEFNARLRASKHTTGKWQASKTPVHRLLGKEMMILAWAVADCDPSVIDIAIKNWLGLRAEERWWLYTMTNATSGKADDNFGWRRALRYALTENPIADSTNRQASLFTKFKEDEL